MNHNLTNRRPLPPEQRGADEEQQATEGTQPPDYADAIPGTFRPDVAHPARVYACWIGGKDYYPADLQAAEEVARRRPQVVAGARVNRAFLARAVRYLTAERGIRQFLDIGPGLPAPGNTHEVALAIAPDSRVVYADSNRCKSGCAHAYAASRRGQSIGC